MPHVNPGRSHQDEQGWNAQRRNAWEVHFLNPGMLQAAQVNFTDLKIPLLAKSSESAVYTPHVLRIQFHLSPKNGQQHSSTCSSFQKYMEIAKTGLWPQAATP